MKSFISELKVAADEFKVLYKKYFWGSVLAVIGLCLLPQIIECVKVAIPIAVSFYAEGINICGKPLASVTLGELILVFFLFHIARIAIVIVWGLYKILFVSAELDE
ncbi:MAG: hypothetical protein LLG04_01245 [Parachlamydia sp.]|nr:hypothetical protein [Parachlamydia sp.]